MTTRFLRSSSQATCTAGAASGAGTAGPAGTTFATLAADAAESRMGVGTLDPARMRFDRLLFHTSLVLVQLWNMENCPNKILTVAY